MSRPRREELILQTAGRVFAHGGYDRASMDRIAELVGVSKPMLYAYFGSKEGLYLAYIERTGSELVRRLVDAGAGGGSDLPRRTGAPPARLRAVVAEFLGFVEDRRDGWTVLFAELTSSRPPAEQVAGLRAEIVVEVRRMLERGSATASGLEPPASEGVAEAIVGAGESLANWWLTRSDVPRDDVADWFVSLTRAAISAGTPRPI